MKTPRIAAALLACTLFAGCSGNTPTASEAPRPSGTAPQSSLGKATMSPAPQASPGTATPSSASRSPWAAPTPGADGKIAGYYPGVRLRFIPHDPATTLACRPITKSERALLDNRGNRIDRPTKPVAVDLPEGWVLVASWGSHAGVDPYPTALVTDGGTYQELISTREPQDWPGTHTNAGIAWEDGPAALRAALHCIEAIR